MLLIQFARDGVSAGPPLEITDDVTRSQLEALLNSLLDNQERLPYSFFVAGEEVLGTLAERLLQNQVSVEAVVCVEYQPQAVFRVRPVTRCASSIAGHSEAILSVTFSPDGRSLASGSGDATVRLWDVSTLTPLHTCQGHSSWVLAVSWSPDAVTAASGDHNGGVWLWSAKTGRPLGQCRGHQKFITSMAWEPAHVELPARRFCTSSKDATIRVWDAGTRRCLFTMSNHTQAVTQVKWGGAGLIYSAGRDCKINVWRAEDGKLVRSLKGHGHWVNTMSLSTDYVLRMGAFDHTGQLPQAPELAKAASQLRFDAATGPGLPERLATGSDDFTLVLWNPAQSCQPLARLTGHTQLINHVVFSPDGRSLASASFDKSVKVWSGEDGTFVATFRGHVGAVYQVAWSADSRLLVSASKDSTLKVWDIQSRSLLAELPGHADEVFSVDWSPSGGLVASGGKDRVLKLWSR